MPNLMIKRDGEATESNPDDRTSYSHLSRHITSDRIANEKVMYIMCGITGVFVLVLLIWAIKAGINRKALGKRKQGEKEEEAEPKAKAGR